MKTPAQLRQFFINYPDNKAMDIVLTGSHIPKMGNNVSYRKCIELNQEGYSANRIAGYMGVSQSTISRLFQKLRDFDVYDAAKQSGGLPPKAPPLFNPNATDVKTLICGAWV